MVKTVRQTKLKRLPRSLEQFVNPKGKEKGKKRSKKKVEIQEKYHWKI